MVDLSKNNFLVLGTIKNGKNVIYLKGFGSSYNVRSVCPCLVFHEVPNGVN